MSRARWLGTAVALVWSASAQGSLVFDFENASAGQGLPMDLTVGGVTAHFSSSGVGGYFVQTPGNTILYTPVGFSGLCLVPSAVYGADLHIGFSEAVTDFSILYAPQELACDSSARLRVTAYMDAALVGTNTKVASPAGTWPSAKLVYTSAQPFNNVVVHYDAPPPTGGDYGVIFLADNVQVTVAVPEVGSLGVVGLGVMVLLWRRRWL